MLLFDGSFKTFAANTTLSVFMTNYYNIFMQDMTAILNASPPSAKSEPYSLQ